MRIIHRHGWIMENGLSRTWLIMSCAEGRCRAIISEGKNEAYYYNRVKGIAKKITRQAIKTTLQRQVANYRFQLERILTLEEVNEPKKS